MAAKKPLITFRGWDGKWWRRIKVGRALWEAGTWTMPLKYQLVYYSVREAGKVVLNGFIRQHPESR